MIRRTSALALAFAALVGCRARTPSDVTPDIRCPPSSTGASQGACIIEGVGGFADVAEAAIHGGHFRTELPLPARGATRARGTWVLKVWHAWQRSEPPEQMASAPALFAISAALLRDAVSVFEGRLALEIMARMLDVAPTVAESTCPDHASLTEWVRARLREHVTLASIEDRLFCPRSRLKDLTASSLDPLVVSLHCDELLWQRLSSLEALDVVADNANGEVAERAAYEITNAASGSDTRVRMRATELLDTYSPLPDCVPLFRGE